MTTSLNETAFHEPPVSPYATAVERGCKGLTAVSTDVCPGCEECRRGLGFATLQDLEKAWESGRIVSEPFFSSGGCDICGAVLGGNFEVWHGIDEKGEIVHGDRACEDCVVYLANGDEPETWEPV